jgi:hypothetical protein
VLRRIALWASALFLLAYCVQGPIAYTLVTLLEEDDDTRPVRPSVVPLSPLSSEGPIFWGRVVLTVENETPHTVILEDVSVGGIRAFSARTPVRPVGDRFSARTSGVAQRPGPHRVQMVTRLEGGASAFEQLFEVEIEAGYERRCIIALHEAGAEMAPCERGGRTDGYGLFD